MNVLAAPPKVQDATIAAVAAGFAVLALALDLGESDSTPNVLSYLIVGVVAAALLLRRQHPIAVLAVVVTARVLLTWDTADEVPLVLAAAVALYTVARSGDRRHHLSVAVCAALVMMVAVAALDKDSFLPEFLGEGAQLLLPIAVGDAVRSRADRLRDLIDTEANSRVQAERLRIARDLHDVVAHGLSTIAIQSGVAAHLLDRNPGQAKEALEIINATGKSSLEELRVMVGVLRSTDDVPLRPTPADPNDLADLLEGATHAGIAVTTSIDGKFPTDVADSCVVAVHRIIQEALTNVARHAGAAPTELSIRHNDQTAHVSITNQAGSARRVVVPSTGVGIIGMTERAEALGGTLTTNSLTGGGFEVVATVPYHPRTNGEPTR